MDLVQSRIVTDDVERLAAFYARLVGVSVVLNDYVEVPTGAASVGFSRRRFTEFREDQAARPCSAQHQAKIMLDFRAADVDAEYKRISRLGVTWVIAARHAAVGVSHDDLQGPGRKPRQRLLPG